MKQYVSYIRVSTDKQGQSGLGLEAQRETCERFAGQNPIIEEFVEVESGRDDYRPVLQKAMAYAKKHNATLLIAKLDRLSRKVSFIFKLMDDKVDFVAADLPEFNTLSIGIFATFAQYEAERISQRTRDALQAKIARGEKWWRKLTKEERDKGREKGIETQRAKFEHIKNAVQNLASRGLNIMQIRESLYIAGIKSPSGGPISSSTVWKYYHQVKKRKSFNDDEIAA
jgi:DNA invertase Pin-like site-specific DNA recombinase